MCEYSAYDLIGYTCISLASSVEQNDFLHFYFNTMLQICSYNIIKLDHQRNLTELTFSDTNDPVRSVLLHFSDSNMAC